MTQISIKGMTCGGCENDVTAALTAVPGVIKVVSVSHKDGLAVVCTDKTKCESGSLTKAVSAKGFEAKIMPAVAKTTAATGSTCGMGAKTDVIKASAKKACGSDCTKDCCANKGDAKKTSAEDSK
jgi:copper chaperone CopZ